MDAVSLIYSLDSNILVNISSSPWSVKCMLGYLSSPSSHKLAIEATSINQAECYGTLGSCLATCGLNCNSTCAVIDDASHFHENAENTSTDMSND